MRSGLPLLLAIPALWCFAAVPYDRPNPEEVLLVHFLDRGGRLELEGAMIAPGRVRPVRRLPADPILVIELVDEDGAQLSGSACPDPRPLFAEPDFTGAPRSLATAASTAFSLKIPWFDGGRRLRVRDGDDRVLFDGPVSPNLVALARERFRTLEREIFAERRRYRPVAPRAPAVSSPATPNARTPATEERPLPAIRELEAAERMFASGTAVASDGLRAAVAVSVLTLSPDGSPISKVGVIALDSFSGQALVGAETDTNGRALLNVAASRVRFYFFPPYTTGTSPYARRVLDTDLAGQSTVSLEQVLDGGVLVSGTVTRNGADRASGYWVTAVDAGSGAAVEYARTDASGAYTMRLAPGRYTMYVSSRPGWGGIVDDAHDISGTPVTLSYALSAQPLPPVTGRVLGAAGEPIAGARVTVYDSAATVHASLTTGDDGAFSGTAPSDGFLFVYPNSATRYQAHTLPLPAAGPLAIVLPEVPEVTTPDPTRPQLGLVYGDSADKARINLVFVGDGFTNIDEPFTDTNGNGKWDGDVYLDENGNGQYDSGETYFNRNGVAGYQPPEPFEDSNGDGVRNSDEQALFERNVVDYVRVLMGTSPWPDLLNRINVWRIRTVSRQAAGSFQEFGIVRDTALGTSYGVKSTGYIISVSNLRLTELVQALVPDYDHIITVSNSPYNVGRANANFGGNLRLKGGDFDNLSTVATHELGHSVGLLTDEYTDSTVVATRFIYKGTEPSGPNVTTIPDCGRTKWAAELDGTVPCPTPPDIPGPGVFEGGATYFRGVYRPEYNCMMRFNTPRFCVVCNREMRAQIIDRSSTNALTFPLLVFNLEGPPLDRLQTAFSAVNPDPARSLTLAWTATNGAGRLIVGRGVSNPRLATLAPLQQDARFEREFFGSLRPSTGWVEVNSDGPARGFYLVADPDFGLKVDGGVANPDTSADLALPMVSDGAGAHSRISVVNPSARSSRMSVGFIDPTGRVLQQQDHTMPAKGHLMLAPPEGLSGWARVRSTTTPAVQLQAAAVQYDDRSLAVATASALDVPAGILVFPHYAVGGGYETRLFLVTVAPAALQLTARRNDGSVAGNTIIRSLAALEQLNVSVRELFGLDPGQGIEVGYITVSDASTKPAALQGVAGLACFNFGGESAAVAVGERAPREVLFFSHIANEVPAGGGRKFHTGLAILNPGPADARFTITAYDENGVEARRREMVLGAGQKLSRLLSGEPNSTGFFPAPFKAASGYVVVRSNVPLYGFQLFFTGDLALMAAVPAQ